MRSRHRLFHVVLGHCCLFVSQALSIPSFLYTNVVYFLEICHGQAGRSSIESNVASERVKVPEEREMGIKEKCPNEGVWPGRRANAKRRRRRRDETQVEPEEAPRNPLEVEDNDPNILASGGAR
jgi:hypothetical protein